MPATYTSQTITTTGGGFYVTITTPGGTTTRKIEGDLLSVGRGEDCNLSIPHETLSRRHMTVQLRNGQMFVEDHGSSNGTFVNGKRLKPHTPMRVLPEDFVLLGQSGVRLGLATEFRGKNTPPPPLAAAAGIKEEDPALDETIVTTTAAHRRQARAEQPTPEPKKTDEAQEQAERLVNEAQKKAAMLVQESELEAERRVEDIYRRAHETQKKMDDIYQRRLNEAYRSAEKVYQKSQSESEIILDQARQKAAEMRAQAEGFVMDLRRRTEDDCERILEEAQHTARELKENRLLEAEEMIRKEEELVRNTREAMTTRLARFEEELLKEAARQRELLEGELTERRAQLERDHKEQIDSIHDMKNEIRQLEAQRERETEHLREIDAAVVRQTAHTKSLKDEAEDAKKAVIESGQALTQIRNETEIVTRERTAVQDQLAKLRFESKTTLEKLRAADENMDNELLRMREKFEANKGKLLKEEQRHLEELKLETSRKVRTLENSLVEELTIKKERLSRELALLVETFLKENPELRRGGAKILQDQMAKLLDLQVATLSKDPGAKIKQKSLVALKAREKRHAAFVGGVLSVSIAFLSQNIYKHVSAEKQTPMARKVAAAAEARKVDLEARKFNPPQTPELRSGYTDSVIYTEKFVETYLDEDFQRKLLKAATPFLLKTWRVDEDRVIELLSTSSSLVKALNDRKANIHPDFVPQALEKMKDLENEYMDRMRRILGSQVRVDSFRKFQAKFYQDYTR